MNRIIIVTLTSLLLLFGWLAFVSPAASSDTPSPVSNVIQQTTDCIVQPHGILGSVVCAGQTVQQIPLPVVTIIPSPARTTLPVRTVTVTPVPVTKTIYQELAPPTVFLTPPPKTVFVQRNISGPEVVVTKTASALPLPQSTATVTVTAHPARQTPPERGRIGGGGIRIPFTEHANPAVKVGLGALAAVVIVGLILIGLYLGYTIGWKDKERKDTNFMRAVLEQSTLRKR